MATGTNGIITKGELYEKSWGKIYPSSYESNAQCPIHDQIKMYSEQYMNQAASIYFVETPYLKYSTYQLVRYNDVEVLRMVKLLNLGEYPIKLKFSREVKVKPKKVPIGTYTTETTLTTSSDQTSNVYYIAASDLNTSVYYESNTSGTMYIRYPNDTTDVWNGTKRLISFYNLGGTIFLSWIPNSSGGSSEGGESGGGETPTIDRNTEYNNTFAIDFCLNESISEPMGICLYLRKSVYDGTGGYVSQDVAVSQYTYYGGRANFQLTGSEKTYKNDDVVYYISGCEDIDGDDSRSTIVPNRTYGYSSTGDRAISKIFYSRNY